MGGTARPRGGKLALLAALLVLLAAGAIAWSGYLATAPEPAAPPRAATAPGAPLTAPLPSTTGGDPFVDRTLVAMPARLPAPAAPFTVRITGVAPELLPHLRVHCTTAGHADRQELRPDATGAVQLTAPAPPQRLTVATANGDRILVDAATDDWKVVPVPGGEATCSPPQRLVGLQLIDRSGRPRPFALGVGQPATDLEQRLLQILDASSQDQHFFVALGSGPQSRIGREGLRAEGAIWSLDLRLGVAIAELLLSPTQGMATAPERLHVAAAGPDYYFPGVRTSSGWRLALEAGDYNLHWLLNGPRLLMASGVHLESGETRELQVTLPETHAYRGTITNWEQVPPRQRARMLRISSARANLDQDGTFELLLAEPLPGTLEIELGRLVAENWTMAGRPGRLIARDDACGTLRVEDTASEQGRLRVSCAALHDGVVGIQVWRHLPGGLMPDGVLTDGGEVLLRPGHEELLLAAVEKVGRRSWPLAMQVVANTPGEIVLQPGTRAVTVHGGDGWSFTPIPPGSFRGGCVLVLRPESGTLFLPAGSCGIRARRSDVVREFPADAVEIDLR